METVPLSILVDPDDRPLATAIRQDAYDLDCPWHRHDMHQLQYAFEGSIEVEDRQARYLLPKALAAWIPAGVPHRTSIHRVKSGSILFDADAVMESGDRIRIIEVSSLMREMVMGAMRWPIGEPQNDVARNYFATLAGLCSEWISREAPLSLPTTQDARLAVALSLTRAELHMDLQACCRAAAMSERTLRRKCSKLLGMNWEEYRRRARLVKAATLLNDTVLPIGVIAADVGFESQSAFAKAFKKLTGMGPREFRSASDLPESNWCRILT